MVAQVTDATFDAEVINEAKTVLVDFYADWCGPCQALAPHIDALSQDKPDLKIVKMNIDENPMTPSKFNIRSIPTLIIFKGGKVVDTKMGSMPKTALNQWVDEKAV